MTWIICDREVSGFDSESRVGVQMGSVCTENRKNVYLTRECGLYRLHDVLSWVGTLWVEKKLCKWIQNGNKRNYIWTEDPPSPREVCVRFWAGHRDVNSQERWKTDKWDRTCLRSFDARVHPQVRTQAALQKTWEHLRLHAGSLRAGTLQSDRVLPCVLSCGWGWHAYRQQNEWCIQWGNLD